MATLLDGRAPAPPSEELTFEHFLESIPPGREMEIAKPPIQRSSSAGWFLNYPSIQLHCLSESCGRSMLCDPFSGSQNISYQGGTDFFYVHYFCRHCKKITKTIALRCTTTSASLSADFAKLGEIPTFGPPTPPKVLKLLGSEREYFLKGRTAENQGLGIAAFAYYRRVVERQKDKIIGEILRVAKILNAPQEVIAELEQALHETQFSTAIESIKHGLPQILLIDGHSPLKLLHSALSEGLHAQTDEKCLEFAAAVRLVLAELVARVDIALTEQSELKSAVGLLTRARQ